MHEIFVAQYYDVDSSNKIDRWNIASTIGSTAPNMDTALTLSNGCKLPMVGFGTYKVGKVPTSTSRPCDAGRDAKAVLKDALNAGYRLIDCAEYYLNEKEVGEAIQVFFGAMTDDHVSPLIRTQARDFWNIALISLVVWS